MHYPTIDFLGTVSSIFSFIMCTISKVQKEEEEMKRDDKRTSGKMGVDGKMKGESGRGKARRILFLTNYGILSSP